MAECRFTSCIIIQMVGLYKDPKGESVFSDFHTKDGGIAGSVQLNRPTTAFGTEETLRKKIIELENVLCTYKVSQCRYIANDPLEAGYHDWSG